MEKQFKPFKKQEPPPAKAMKQLVDAFCDTYKPVSTEEMAEELFTMRKLREYFQAWPIPKMPDPLPPYLDELELKGYAMQTGYDGSPAIFCIRWKSRGEICKAEEVDERQLRTGAESVGELIARRISKRLSIQAASRDEEEEEDLDDENDEEEE